LIGIDPIALASYWNHIPIGVPGRRKIEIFDAADAGTFDHSSGPEHQRCRLYQSISIRRKPNVRLFIAVCEGKNLTHLQAAEVREKGGPVADPATPRA
jgi:hypothetical protein